MGRRSISTTKSGKFMNPTDQARKEARKRELKKNKKQRQMVRAAVLKGKDPHQLITDMEKIDQMEYNVNFPSPLNEKVLKDKRKKMKETWDRVMRLYHKEDPERWEELKRMELDYENRRFTLIRYYESVKYAQSVQVDDIPLPEAPLMDMILPSQIPLPSEMPGFPFMRPQDLIQPSHSILKKKSSAFDKAYLGSRKPPGVPPGPPPLLSDGEEENDMDDEETETLKERNVEPGSAGDKKQLGKSRRIRFADEQESSETGISSAKPSGEDADIEEDVEPELIPPSDIPMPPMPLQPGIGLPSRLPPGPPPMIFRAPLRPGTSGIRMLPPGLPPPPGSRPTGLPPGPPPGLPPRLAHIRLPPGPPPGLPPVRLLRPPMTMAPPPGTKPPTSNVVSAPPSLIPRPPKGSEEEKRSATIEAKPQLRSLSAELTKFLPTTLRIKREDKLRRGPGAKNTMPGDSVKEIALSSVKATVTGPTKDDTYEQFMKEMSGLL